MPKFSFRARDWSGKLVKGEVEMSSEVEVIASVKEGGMVPLAVVLIQDNVLSDLSRKVFGRVGLKQVATLTRQLSTMLVAGLPLTDALSLLKSQSDNNLLMKEILEHMLATVRGGLSLGKAMERYRGVFGEAYIASIVAGEEGGVLEEVLAKLADNLENENEFRGKVTGAMIYPAIIVSGMIGVTIIMMVVVIPKLTGLYKDFGTSAKMPGMTLALMTISGWMARFWFLFPGVIFGGYSFFKFGSKNPRVKLAIDTYKLKMPILGPLTRKAMLANTMRTMSMLLGAGISLVDCLRIVANVADNEQYRLAFVRISERVQKGFAVADSFEETGLFPPLVNQMVATGEATGKLDEVLMRVSDYFATEADQAIKTLTSAIEPLVMILLGVGVAFLVIAVIMPIYNLTSSFK